MKILSNNLSLHPPVVSHKKMDKDEVIIRRALVRVWIKILQKYATPNMSIPSVEDVWRELLEKGVDGAVEALVAEHWYVWPFMVRERIEENVKDGLKNFNLANFIEEIKDAQYHPAMLEELEEKIRRFVMEGV